jgi:hypothetical protein
MEPSIHGQKMLVDHRRKLSHPRVKEHRISHTKKKIIVTSSPLTSNLSQFSYFFFVIFYNTTIQTAGDKINPIDKKLNIRDNTFTIG